MNGKDATCRITNRNGSRCDQPRLAGEPICQAHFAMLDQKGIGEYDFRLRLSRSRDPEHAAQRESNFLRAIAEAERSVRRSENAGLSFKLELARVAARPMAEHYRDEVKASRLAETSGNVALARQLAPTPPHTRRKRVVGTRSNARGGLR